MRGHDDAATTRRRRRQPRCRCSPGSQSLQPPCSQSLQCPGRHRSFRRRYSPSLAAAPSLQVPSQSLQPPSLTGLTAPLTQEDGWWRRGRRRDDDDATTSTGGRDGAERTEGDAHLQGSLFGAESGDGGPDGGPLGAVRAGRCFLDWLVVEEVTQLDVGPTSPARQVRFLLLGDFRQLPAVQDAFGGAPVLRMLESQLLPIWPAVSSTSSLRTSEATRKSFPFWSGCGWARRSRWSCGMQCRGRRSSRGVGPDTCLVISHAHRIAINEQEKGSGAGRRCAGAGTKVAKGSFVEVWEVGSGFCWTTARASRERSCSATRGCATRSPTPACWGSRCAGGSGSATPTTRIFR